MRRLSRYGCEPTKISRTRGRTDLSPTPRERHPPRSGLVQRLAREPPAHRRSRLATQLEPVGSTRLLAPATLRALSTTPGRGASGSQRTQRCCSPRSDKGPRTETGGRLPDASRDEALGTGADFRRRDSMPRPPRRRTLVPARAAATRTDERQSERLPSRGAERPVGISQLAQDVGAGLLPRLDVSRICLMVVNPFV